MPGPRFRFEPLADTIPKPRSYIAFDTETTSEGAFICGAYYGQIKTNRGYQTVSEYCATLEEFRDTFLSIEAFARSRKRSFVLVGFNTSYDLIYLDDIVESSFRVDAGTRFIQAKTVNGTKIYDISNHVIGTLDEWIKRLNMQERYGILKREHYLETEEGKRGQVLDDARATYLLTEYVEKDLIEKFGIPLPPTKFGAALKIFQKHYFKDRWYRTDREQWKNNFERRSYYGGRCEVFRRGMQAVESYDVNSMYVAIMRDELIPNPTITRYIKNADQIRGMINSEFMTVECRVRVPRIRIGLLPYKDKKNNKLIFPYGEWRGVYQSVELREALKWGLEITEIYRAIWYPEAKNYFKDYAQMTMDGRKAARAKGDVAEEQLYKYRGNGLYGKFGQQNAIGGQYIRLSQFTGELEGMRIIPGAGDYWVEIPVEQYEDSWHTFPVVCATITAYARAKMLNALCNNGENAVYCDTDSIKCIGTPTGISIGDEPGQWGYEYTKEQAFYRPKRYADKRKGVPKRAILKEKTEEYEIYTFERPTKFKTAIRSHCNQNVWHQEEKLLSLMDDKREWLEDNSSYPLYVYDDDAGTPEDDTEDPEEIMVIA